MSYEERIAHVRIFQEPFLKDVILAAYKTIPKTERIIVALKGAFKEYLVCTDKMVYIFKEGFMTGHLFGGGIFRMPYSQVTNAEVVFHAITGYFELSAAGLENKALNYWDRKNDPAKQPNAISLVSNQRADFDKAAAFILEQIAASKAPQAHADQTTAEKLRDLKALLDEQILTQEEFEAKKKELLAL